MNSHSNEAIPFLFPITSSPPVLCRTQREFLTSLEGSGPFCGFSVWAETLSVTKAMCSAGSSFSGWTKGETRSTLHLFKSSRNCKKWEREQECVQESSWVKNSFHIMLGLNSSLTLLLYGKRVMIISHSPRDKKRDKVPRHYKVKPKVASHVLKPTQIPAFLQRQRVEHKTPEPPLWLLWDIWQHPSFTWSSSSHPHWTLNPHPSASKFLIHHETHK